MPLYVRLWNPAIYTDDETYSTNEAGVMPGMSKGLDELISCFNREVTSMTFGAEQGNII